MRKEALPFIGLLAAIEASRWAFSKQTRLKMFKRAGGASEISGERFEDGVMLHCMHFNHDKSNPNYDEPEAGLVVTVQEHLDYHLSYVGRAHEINLKECQNYYAIDQLMQTDQRTRAAREEEREELIEQAREALRKANPLRQKRRNRV